MRKIQDSMDSANEKSLLTLCLRAPTFGLLQSEELYPSLAKRGWGRLSILGCSKTALYIILTVFIFSGSVMSAEKNEFEFSKQSEIQQIRPKKPVKIKVHRSAKGEYSWEFSGDNVDEIVNADKRLRKALKAE